MAKNIYKLSSYALSQEKLEEHRKKYETPVRKWQTLKSQGLIGKVCEDIIGISRSNYYRYKATLKQLTKGILPPTKKPKTLRKQTWGESEKQFVLRIRRENPTYGKNKIAVILMRDHNLNLSVSMVGRILKYLMEKGLIQKSLSAPKQKRKRRFKGHAKPWKYKLKSTKPGEMVQIDHITTTKNQTSGEHFQAWDPLSKFIYANVYSNATSTTAKRFLMELMDKAPFNLSSVQVDGGSEFMKEFEKACQELGIQLYVLPSKRPQYNGGVERGNSIFREEFYAKPNLLADSIGRLRAELSLAVSKYNSYRPHFNLDGMTPLDYIKLNYPLAA
ncbi:MAG: integrase core domain-containing protein [Alphaproteobacteria bacterium]|nr:integrase core domain-containing protein [Alphaproteobacteria bacterium]